VFRPHSRNTQLSTTFKRRLSFLAAAFALMTTQGGEMSETFKANVVIVTGASSGIGREVALQLAAQGAKLSLAARDGERLEQVAMACRQRGGQVLVVKTNVTIEAECRNLIERTVAEYNRLDTLINNAGISMWARFDQLQDLSILEQVMRVNYLGAAYCTYYALGHLKQSNGRLVAVSSLAGKNGIPTRSGYAASKHAMAGFFDSLRIELAESGVSVTVIYPGFVTSEIRERAFGADGRPLKKSPVHEAEVMTPDKCAQLIIKAAAQRRREEVMTFRGKLGLWLKLIAPGLVDRVAQRAIEIGR
jgi:NADP-dependent 3-hydroxy acid dehydrogenase YdfG